MIKIHTLKTTPYKSLANRNKKHIPTSLDSLDYAFDGLVSGTVTVVTGRPSEGKSTFIQGAILNAIEKGKRVYIVDGEHERDDLYNKLFRQVIGNDKSLYDEIQSFIRIRYEPKSHILPQLTEWFGDKLMATFKYESDLSDFDVLFQLAEATCSAHKIDLVVYDNLMALVDSTVAEINAKQSKFMKLCTSLAKKADVAVVLAAHPNGTAQKGTELDYYQISGTSDIPNLADNIIQIIKDPIEEDGTILYDGRAVVLKNRYFSDYPKVNLKYDKEIMGLCEMIGDKHKYNKYSWRKEGKQAWLNDKTPF